MPSPLSLKRALTIVGLFLSLLVAPPPIAVAQDMVTLNFINVDIREVLQAVGKDRKSVV